MLYCSTRNGIEWAVSFSVNNRVNSQSQSAVHSMVRGKVSEIEWQELNRF